MTRDGIRATLPRAWLAAAVAATIGMLAWLGWHAASSLATLQRMQVSHAEAAELHDTLLSLRADLQRTIQLGIATGDVGWLSAHTEIEAALRQAVEGLIAVEPRAEDRASLEEAVVAIDHLSQLETRAIELARSGLGRGGLEIVTGEDYAAHMGALTGALDRFDESYHRWGLERSVGLTRQELVSLSGAFVLFAVVIGAWLLLIRRLQRERDAVVREMDRRSQAETQLLHAQKNEVLGQLSGGVAHDVDNVLSAAAGYAALARRAGNDGARRLALDGLDRAVAQGRGLTRNLLSFTRQESSVRRPVELTRLIRETQSWLAPLLPASVRLEVRASGSGELWVEADPVQLQQAFANLALNARDAMPDGGTLEVSLCRRPAELVGPRSGHCRWSACLSVRDTGVGMDAETLARAKEPLFTTKPPGQGTGLGLPAVVRVIESHGGLVEIDSAPGRGTQVRMLLPALSQGPGNHLRNGAGVPAHRRALVVCADAYARQLLAATLEDAGLEVAELADAAALVDSARGALPADVVVIEWSGTPQGAAELLSGLRRRDERVAVILVADSDTQDNAAVVELACVVARPAPLAELGALAFRLSIPTAKEVRA